MIFKLQLFSTLLLTGLIITVQFIHYPLWQYVSKERMIAFEKRHQKLITPIVSSLMIVEAITAFFLLDGLKPLYIINFMALCGIWLSTFFLQVPMHYNLVHGVDLDRSIEKLIKTNYIRTFLWTFRAIALTFFA